MTTADWALIISVVSALVSAAGFIWNVWSKFIYPKPKLLVSFTRMHTVDEDGNRKVPVLVLAATNVGPGPVTLRMAINCKRWRWQREVVGLLNPLDSFPATTETSKGPFAGGLPKKLEVGDEHVAYFGPNSDWDTPANIAEHPYIGFSDVFRREHLTRITPKKEPTYYVPKGTLLTRARKRLRKFFSAVGQ